MFLAQYWGGPPDYSAEKGHPRLRMRHAPFAIGAGGTRRLARGDARRPRRHGRAGGGQSGHAGVLRDGGDRHDQLRRDNGAVSKRQQKEKMARRRVASPSRRGPPRARSARAGCRPTASGAGRDPAPAVRARCARARSPPSRPTNSSIACARRASPHAKCSSRSATRCGPGVTTDELDRICHEACIARGGYPSPLHYKGFPKSLCTSVNEIICHGIPDDRVLDDGDIVNCDVTIFLNGVHGDTNATFLVGDVDDVGRDLVRVTKEAMWKGIDAVQVGSRINDIGRAIQEHAEARGLRRRARVRRPRNRRAVPHHAVGAPLLRPARRHADRRGNDVHDRADDHRRLVGARPHLVRRMDRARRPISRAPRSSSTPCSSPRRAPRC